MPNVDNTFERLMRLAQGGCESAARQLYEEYSQHVIRVVRRRLNRRLRRQLDSDDIAQSVWASFFGAPLSAFAFAKPNDLVQFLELLARNKVIDRNRRHAGTAKRNYAREKSLDELPDPNGLVDPRQMTASKACIADDRWEALLRDQPPRVREILVLSRLGFTSDEIAQRMGLHPRTIKRQLQKASEACANE